MMGGGTCKRVMIRMMNSSKLMMIKVIKEKLMMNPKEIVPIGNLINRSNNNNYYTNIM